MQFISMAGEDKEMIENNICYLIANKDLQLYTDTTVKYSMDFKEGVKGGKKTAVPPQNYKKFSDVSEYLIIYIYIIFQRIGILAVEGQ